MATEKRLIDANALLESGYNVKMDEVFPDWHELPVSTQEAVCKHGQYLKKIINELPTVDAVEVVHGWWIHDINNLYGCSECGERETMSPKKPKNYCPNCGAKMDGGSDND